MAWPKFPALAHTMGSSGAAWDMNISAPRPLKDLIGLRVSILTVSWQSKWSLKPLEINWGVFKKDGSIKGIACLILSRFSLWFIWEFYSFETKFREIISIKQKEKFRDKPKKYWNWHLFYIIQDHFNYLIFATIFLIQEFSFFRDEVFFGWYRLVVFIWGSFK